MFALLFRKSHLFFLLTWSLFVFSLSELLKVYMYTFDINDFYLFLVASIESIMFLLFYLLFRVRFKVSLKYACYVFFCIVYNLIIFLYAWIYFIALSLNNEFFNTHFYITTAILNIIGSSALFTLTLINKK